MLVDRIESEVRAVQQAAALGLVLGRKVEIPSLEDELAMFDALLAAAPERLDPEELELRRVLGLGRSRG